MKDVKDWMERARKDLRAAENSYNARDYDWSCFQAQQAVEKALKALNIIKYKKLLRAHDLVLLARRVNAPKEIIVLCSKINPSYIDTRYPDLSRIYEKKDAKYILELSKKVLKWTEKSS